MVLVKLKRFSRSKQPSEDSPEPEPQPYSPTQIQTETTPKKTRGRPKRIQPDIISKQSEPEPEQRYNVQQELKTIESINYDDVTNDIFLDDLNNVNYTEVIPETKKPIKEDVKQIIKPSSSFSLDSNKLLDKIKKKFINIITI